MKIITLISLLVICSLSIYAQTADDYFHNSSNYFINGDFKAAKVEIKNGLAQFPNNQKLKALEAEIKKEEEKEQKEQEKKNQNNEEQKQDEKKNDQNKQQEQNQQNQPDQNAQTNKISKEDAMRLLEALQNDEKNVQEKVQKQKVQAKKRTSEKDW